MTLIEPWPFANKPAVWFSCMPGVRITMSSFGRPAAVVLVHPAMRPAIVNLETGELHELDFEPVRGEYVAPYLTKK